jgi:hypothetical protein
MSEPTKSEDQIAKDKEAIAKMVGAKSAMEAAIRRIETLENCIKSVREQVDVIGKAFGESVHLNVYSYSHRDYRVIKARDLFGGIDNTIKAVL